MSEIADAGLAPEGARRIAWAETRAPVMRAMRSHLAHDGVLRDRRVSVDLPLTPDTALLVQILAEAGGDVAVTSPPSMVQDDVAAALAASGVDVFAVRDESPDDERRHLELLVERRPHVIIDDRADLVRLVHDDQHHHALDDLMGATEQTTSGVEILRRMDASQELRVPVIAGNDACCKHLFDNRYGSGQSVVTTVLDRTNRLMAGARVVVVGYGWVGKGVARVAAGLGGRVTVTEVDPLAALEAHHDGFDVAPVAQACAAADFVITCSGARHAVGDDAVDRCSDGAVLANAAGIDDEFDVRALARRARSVREARPCVTEYVLADSRSIFVVGGGHCVNLSAAEGHPVEVMDLTFAVQGLAASHLLAHGATMTPGLHELPPEIDDWIAREKLIALGIAIDGAEGRDP